MEGPPAAVSTPSSGGTPRHRRLAPVASRERLRGRAPRGGEEEEEREEPQASRGRARESCVGATHKRTLVHLTPSSPATYPRRRGRSVGRVNREGVGDADRGSHEHRGGVSSLSEALDSAEVDPWESGMDAGTEDAAWKEAKEAQAQLQRCVAATQYCALSTDARGEDRRMQEALAGVDTAGLSEGTAQRLARARAGKGGSAFSPKASAQRPTSAKGGANGRQALGARAKGGGRQSRRPQSAAGHARRRRAPSARQGTDPSAGAGSGSGASLADAVLGTETRHRSPSGKSLRELRQPSAVYKEAMSGVRGARARGAVSQGKAEQRGPPRVGQGMASVAEVHAEVLPRGRRHGPVHRGDEAVGAPGVGAERPGVSELIERVWEEPEEFP